MNKELMKNYAATFMEKVAVIHSAFDETPKTVAFVLVDKKLSDKEKCEIAFMKTNSIDNAWWNNEEVTKMFDGEACRSTSSGDHVLIGNKKYKCARIGWELV
tara:strand:+ start:3007 stop:3312 length:306 start_codon:yes stop_codon:yes gene_type:complete